MKTGFQNYTPKIQCFKGSNSPATVRNSILKREPFPSSQSVPEWIDLSNDDAVLNYTRAKIKGLVDFERASLKTFDKDKFSDSVVSKIGKGDVNSSNIEMLLDLVHDKKLPSSVLLLINEGRVSKSVNDDLDRLYGAYITGENAEDIFVPNFESEKEASDSLKTGEVCLIKGESNVSIKTPDGKIKELFISKETYLKLFPPVERFIINQSANNADCYLLSSLDSLYHNPNTRSKILEMFRENPDGTIDVSYTGFERGEDGSVKEKTESGFRADNIFGKISNDDYNVSYTAPWVAALEIPMQDSKIKEHGNASFHAAKVYENAFRMLLEKINNNSIYAYDKCDFENARELGAKEGESIFYLGEIYTKEEIEFYLARLKDENSVITPHKTPFWGGEKLYDCPAFKYKDLMKKLDEIKDRDDDSARYARLFLERKKKYYNINDINQNKDSLIELDPIPYSLYCELFNTDKLPPKIIDDGGFPDEAFKILGCETIQHPNASYFSKNPMESFLNLENISGYALVCGTYKEKQKKDDFNIFANHAYSIEPVDTGKNGQHRHFVVRDPHNSAVEETFTPNEILEYFDFVTAAKIS